MKRYRNNYRIVQILLRHETDRYLIKNRLQDQEAQTEQKNSTNDTDENSSNLSLKKITVRQLISLPEGSFDYCTIGRSGA